MSASVARVPTTSAGRYLQQLCKHWSHRLTVAFDAEQGSVDFPNGARLELRADSDTLDLLLRAPDAEEARMRGVVEEHLNRFAFREGPLTFEWRDAPSSQP